MEHALKKKGQVAQQENNGIVLREDKEPKKFAHTIDHQNCRARDHSSRIACNTCVFSCVCNICSGDLELADIIKLRHSEVVRLHNFLISAVPGNLQICTNEINSFLLHKNFYICLLLLFFKDSLFHNCLMQRVEPYHLQ